ncbi:glycosyltransferase family 2 protein [Neobacillus vireti]|uniref:glycosyltransferase family 2 protein n=1 Tax=Neobacillus vireti TaxID=220686 RepID=UPI002FFF6CB0
MKPIISIIVPVYNVEKYLSRCIDSILCQTFKDFELILVNDGSSDTSGLICDSYSSLDHRIKVIHKNNGGVSSARNVGLGVASGEYIAFVDSDDLVHESMYALLHNYASKHSSDIVICDYLETLEGNHYDLKSFIDVIKEHSYNNIEALNELFTEKKMQFGSVVWNKLYKKSLFDNIKFEEGKIHEDEFITHKVLYRSSKVVYIPIKLYYYLQRKDGIMGTEFNFDKLDAVEAYKSRADFFKQVNLTDLQRKAEYNYVNLFFKYYFKAKNTIPNSEFKLVTMKREFRRNLKTLNKNPYYNQKEKILWRLFVLNSFLYELYIKTKSNVS